jgi:hypothetical protein
MSVSSRARRVHRRLPWRSFQALQLQLHSIRPSEDESFILAALTADVAAMSFEQKVCWVRHLGKVREAEESANGPIDFSVEDTPPSLAERDLSLFLHALDELSLLRVQTLYYLGRGDDDDPASLHAYLQTVTPDRHDAVRTILGKAPLDECLGAGLKQLGALLLDPNSAWHRRVPRDFVRDPVGSVPIRAVGRATFHELIEVFSEARTVPLVRNSDPEMGPYSSCITVPDEEVEAWCSKGFRTRSFHEQEETEGDMEDYTEGWKHND